MTEDLRKNIIATILKHEELRPLSRLTRLMKDPLRAFPYYILAAISHVKPFAVSFKTLWGTKMISYLPEGNTFFYYGYCEANLTNFFLRYLREDMIVLDIGAHVGIYTMLASELVGDTGQVHSFEPTPSTFAILTKNTASLHNVTITNAAVSSSKRTLTFSDYGAGYSAYNSASSAGGQGIHRQPRVISVASTTIDDYCNNTMIHPSLIKIDAEGFESEVLSGGTKIFDTSSTNRPLVTIEVAGEAEWAKNRHDSFSFLTSHDYVPYTLLPDGTITPHSIQESYRYDNLLFVPRERISEIEHSLL